MGAKAGFFLSTIRKTDVILFLLWICAFLIICPTGNFPVNDDWAYSKNVYNLAVKHSFVLDQFPAMNLVSQTVYGSIWVGCFSFSFFVLRMSVFVLAIVSSLILKKLAFRLSGGQEWFSFFVTALLFFNPLLLLLSFTFMTDIFFLSMVIFAFYQFYCYLQKDRILHYILYVLFAMLAVLNRQHGLLIAFLSPALVFGNKKKWIKALLVALPPVLTWLAHDKYRHYLAEFHIANGIRYTKDLQEYLAKAPIDQHFLHLGDSLLVIGSVLIPMALLLLLLNRNFAIKDMVKVSVVSISMALLTFSAWKFYPIGNISGVLEAGPKVVKTDHIAQLIGSMEVIRIVQLIFSYASITLSVFFLSRNSSALSVTNKLLPYLTIFVAFVLLVFVSVSEAYFDRYNIPVIVLTALVLIPGELPPIGKRIKVMLSILLIGLFSLSVLEIRDYFNWQETRWAALRHLNQTGVSAKRIDGGFEYNGWYKPIEGWPAAGKSWWWVNDDEYVVSTQALQNYQVDSAFIYQKLIPYTTDTIFVLKRKSDP